MAKGMDRGRDKGKSKSKPKAKTKGKKSTPLMREITSMRVEPAPVKDDGGDA